LSRSHGVVALNDGDDQATRSNLGASAGNRCGSRGATKTSYSREVDGFMHICLTDVLVNRIVRNKADRKSSRVRQRYRRALRIEHLIVVRYAGEQRSARLITILTRDGCIGLRGLEWHAVFSGAV
jgi:hypothetical protein